MKLEAGQVAVVTGGASGIGFAIAEALAARGVNLAIADIETAALESAVESLSSKGVEVMGESVDVASADAVSAFAAKVTGRFGTPQLLFNNAGVGGGGPIAELKLDDWRWVLGVNLNGVIHGLDAFLSDMMAAGKPAHVVNTASVAGLVCEAWMGPYNASKFAVVAISETMARELAESNVGVSVLCPGFVDTKIAESARNAPAGAAISEPPAEMGDLLAELLAGGQKPEQTAARVVEAIESGELYILTHPELNPQIEQRIEAIRSALPKP